MTSAFTPSASARWHLADSELSGLAGPDLTNRVGCWRLHFSVAAVSGWRVDDQGPALSGYLRQLKVQLDGVSHSPEPAALRALIFGRLGGDSRVKVNGQTQSGLALVGSEEGSIRLELNLALGGWLFLQGTSLTLVQPLDASAFGEAMSC